VRDDIGGGATGTAGLWLNTANVFGDGGVADIGFIGAVDPTRIGFFGNDPRGGSQWGFTFDTVTGNVGIGTGTAYPTAKLQVNGELSTGILQITGGGDLAEPFSIEENVEVEPGTVMVIDECYPGRLKISDSAHDRKVAGIVSGAGGLKPGLTLQQGHISEGHTHVALAGRVYCRAEAISNPIEPGDLLTTSDMSGHAMKAINPQASHGSIVGKAMSSLREGKGLVLVLVNLQ
jgi:hypothetical protein